MHDRYHGELANELGNLVSRSDRDGRRATATASIPRCPRRPELAAIADREVAHGYERRFETLDFTGALERVWELVRALNRFVEERAPWELARSDEAGAASRGSTRRCATLCEGVRVLGVLLWPCLPAKAPLHAGRGRRGPADDVGFERAAMRQRQRAAGSTVAAAQLFPRIERRPSRRDRHARAPAGPARGRRRRRHRGGGAAGVERIVCVGDSPELARGGDRAVRRAHPGVCRRRSGLHPHRAEAWSDGGARPSSTRCWRDPRVVAVGECGLDYYRERASREAQARAFAGQVELAERHGKPLVIHTREAADDTLAVLRGLRAARRPALLLAARAPRRGRRARLVRVASPATSRTRRRTALAGGGAARAGRAAAARDRLPVPRRPCRTAAGPTARDYVLETLRAVAGLRGEDPGAARRAHVVPERRAAFALP